jgi:hypothetical protein
MGQAEESTSGETSEDPEDKRDEVDEWGEESFPASDPPAAWSGPPED